jgi:hypothetical protein
MATTRTAKAHWEGSLMEGAGQVNLESSGVGTFEVSWPSRAEKANGKTSPEELLGAAHATCFSMALSHALAQAGTLHEGALPVGFGGTRCGHVLVSSVVKWMRYGEKPTPVVMCMSSRLVPTAGTMPPVTPGRHRRSGYAEGEHGPRWFT